MKKRILSIFLVSLCLFSGGVVFAEWEWDVPKVVISGKAERDALIAADKKEAADKAVASKNTTNTSSSQQTGKDNMLSTDFRFDPSNLSPSKKKYTGGTRANLSLLLATIGRYLLIATTTIAVLSITVGGLMIATTGPTDRAAKGKTIITLNIMGVVIALFSYSIIRFVSWIIAA